MMERKITVIGAGSVGATIVYTLAVKAMASEILMIDIAKEKALGEAMDISQGSSFCGNINIHAGDYEEAVNSDIVIITSGRPRKAGQSRLDLTQGNVDIIKSIAPEITKYAPNAMYIIVSNPVDILTYVFHKITNIPEERIIGSGTLLDTTRLRSTLADHYKVNQKNVHAYVLGEHGDSSFVPWSLASISGIPVKEYGSCIRGADPIPEPDYEHVVDFTKKSGGIIIKRKGATNYAIALSVSHICECLFDSIGSIETVSTLLHGEYGQQEVCLSLPTIISSKGVVAKLAPTLTDEEVAKFAASAKSLEDIISQIKL